MTASTSDTPIKELYQHIASKKPFYRSLFSLRSSAGNDNKYFYITAPIQRLIDLYTTFKAADVVFCEKRIIGVHANIGDGKSTLLGFLRHLTGEPVVPVFVEGLHDDDADPSRFLLELVWALLYTLKERGLLEPALYNEIKVAFLRNKDSSAVARAQLVQEQMKLVPSLGGYHLIWLCDNVAHRSYLQALDQLLALRELEPPKRHFFAETPILIVFTTSELELIDVWENDPNRAAAGYLLQRLGVCEEDMFEIVRRILDASFEDLPESLRATAAELRKQNPVYPLVSEDLRLFLSAKARPRKLEQRRNAVKLEVAEIQLRNTLHLLQRLFDAAAKERDCPIDLSTVWKEDLAH